ncbi:MAG: SH3 domain-containing protein [Clostridiales bacterium]|nr:SH3 domain-containing protein [Clostridiales bacterium]
MKRLIAILLTAAMLFSMVTLTASTAVAEQYATVVSPNQYGVRLREGPSTGYSSIRTYPAGTVVTVLQQSAAWSQLQIGTTVGWMMNQYLVMGGSASSSGSAIGQTIVISDNGLRVWLRSKPNGTRLDLYAAGTVVDILEYGSDWCKIRIGNSVGYMMTRYLQLGEDGTVTSPSTPVTTKITGVALNYANPAVGDVLTAIVTPEGATVTYQWVRYSADGTTQEEVGNGATYTVTDKDVGCYLKLTVKGTGSYSGSASYKTKTPVVKAENVTAVSLSKTNPVVGDTLSAVVVPSSAMVSYTWLVAGVEKGNNATYTVMAEDLGKQIQVKVKGTGDTNGTAVSDMTNAVISDKQLISVKLNTTTPKVGTVLTATTNPVAINAKYTWKADDGKVLGTGASYTVTSKDLGKSIQLTVEAQAPYTGTKTTGKTERITADNLESVALTVSGEFVFADIVPVNATADYVWLVNGVEQPAYTNSIYVMSETDNGKTIKVKATGTGIYGGTVEAETKVSYTNPNKLTMVEINNTAPVVDDVLSVTLSPVNLDAVQDQQSLTYIWRVDGLIVQAANGNMGGNTYKVAATDVGKTITVQANAGNGYIGTATSAETSAVREFGKLDAAAIIITENGKNAAGVAPMVGQTLEAVLTPASAASVAQYLWIIDGIGVANTPTLTLTSDANIGKQVGLKVTIPAHTAYNNTDVDVVREMVSLPIANLATLKQDVKAYLPKAVAGQKPTGGWTAKDGDKTLYSATVEWSGDTLDQYGCFKPNASYVATLTITPGSGYRLTDAIFSYDGAVMSKITDNQWEIIFDTAPTQMVTLNHIMGVYVPDAEDEAFSSYVYGDETAQYTVRYKFNNPETATVVLRAKAGYAFTGLPTQFFTVEGADTAAITSIDTVNTTDDKAVLKVKFSEDNSPRVKISAGRTSVVMDGKTEMEVSLQAVLRNWAGDLGVITWEWKLGNAVASGTKLTVTDQDATMLLIDATEAVSTNKQLKVTATAYKGSDVVATRTLNIQLLNGEDEPVVDGETGGTENGGTENSGSASSDAVTLEFTKMPSTVKVGGTAQFAVQVSKGGVMWSVSTNEATIDSNGLLNAGSVKVGDVITVVAVAKEDTSVSAKVNVTVVEAAAPGEITVSLSGPDSVTYGGAKAQFSASASEGGVTWSSSNSNRISADGLLTPTGAEPGDTITVTATSSVDSSVSASKTVQVVGSRMTGSSTFALEEGNSKSFKVKTTEAAFTLTASPASMSGLSISGSGTDTLVVSVTNLADAQLLAGQVITITATNGTETITRDLKLQLP